MPPIIVNKNIKVCYWNINGIHKRFNGVQRVSLLNKDDCVRVVKNQDIFCFAETKTNSNENLDIDGYINKTICRKRSMRAKLDSGGLALYIKETLTKSITIIPHTCSEYIWIQINKKKFRLENYVMLCIYQP